MMQKKNPKDNLEDLFRSYFNDSKKNHQPDGWNVPSEGVWDNIEEELAKEKKPERKFLYWHWVAAAASVLLLVSVFQLYQSNQQLQKLSKQLVENNQAVQKIQSNLQALNEERALRTQAAILLAEEPNNNNNNINKVSPSNYIKKNNTTKEITVFNHLNSINNRLSSKFLTAASPNERLGEATFVADLALVSSDKRLENSQKKELKTSFSQKEKSLNTIFTIDKLPTSTNQLNIANRNINWSSPPINPIFKKRPRLYVAADYSPVQTSIKKSGLEPGKKDAIPKRETQKKTYTAGLQFGIKLNKGWSLETGVRYSSINKSIQHSRIISYRLLQERLNGKGEYESTVNLQLGSSEDAVDTDISLARRSTTTVAPDTKINMNITYANDRNYLDVPLIVRKEWAIGSLALSLKVGLLNRFLLNKSLELQQIIVEDVRFNSTRTTFKERPNPNSNTNYEAHYMAGIGLEYAFQSKLSFYVEPTFIRSIKPVIDPKEGNLYTQSEFVNIGLRYIL